MNELTTKLYKDNPVRIVKKDDETWFSAKDVAEILGYSETSAMTRRLEKDEKTTLQIPQSGTNYTTNVVCINQAGLYVAILGSNKKEAKDFTRWVTHEVLPSIQKTGTYTIPGHERKIELAPEARISKEIDDLKKEKISIEDAYQKLQEINWKIARKELEWCIAHIPDWKLEGLLIHVQREFPDSVRKEVVPVVPELEDGGEA